jgi:hypothetical protein
LVSFAAPGMIVEGTSLCPTPEAVQARLESLRTGGNDGTAAPATRSAPDTTPGRPESTGPAPRSPPPSPQAPGAAPLAAEVDQIENDTVRLLLRRGDETLAERRLEPSRNCDELATAAAVIVASWEADLASGVSLTPGITPPPPLPPPLPPAPPPEPRKVPSGLKRLRYEIGLAFLAAVDGSGLAPGGMVEGALGLGQSPFWLRMAISATGARGDRLAAASGSPAGEVSWTRIGLALGPRYLRNVRGWLLDGHLSAVVALLDAFSSGFPETAQVLDVDPGLAAGVRVLRPIGGGVGIFGGAAVQGWLNTQRLQVRGLSSVDIPRVEALLTLGVSYGRH